MTTENTTDLDLERLLDQLDDIRRSGRANMFDRRDVQTAAHRADHHHLVIFIEDTIQDRDTAAWIGLLDKLGDRLREQE